MSIGDSTHYPDEISLSRDPISASSALLTLLLSTSSVEGFMSELAGLAADVVVPAASCGITTRADGYPITVAFSDSRAAQVDEVQYGASEGPCLEAMNTGAVIDVPDLLGETRWPRYRPHALEHGVCSSLSIPLTADHTTAGALNLYGFAARAFPASARAQAEAFAGHAATALALLLRGIKQEERSGQLERALTSRSTIDQAIGVLIGQQHCTADEAFALLRAHSQNNNIKLRDVAAEIIARTSTQS
jgi:GAF domain-containing protein